MCIETSTTRPACLATLIVDLSSDARPSGMHQVMLDRTCLYAGLTHLRCVQNGDMMRSLLACKADDKAKEKLVQDWLGYSL